jgi:hypothetical protein
MKNFTEFRKVCDKKIKFEYDDEDDYLEYVNHLYIMYHEHIKDGGNSTYEEFLDDFLIDSDEDIYL